MPVQKTSESKSQLDRFKDAKHDIRADNPEQSFGQVLWKVGSARASKTQEKAHMPAKRPKKSRPT
jgi:hypothetical protein